MKLSRLNITYGIYQLLFLALMFALPIHSKLVPPIISLIGINWILEFNFRQKYKRIVASPYSKYLLSFGLLYILYAIGALYSTQMESQKGALFNLEIKLSLWVFPLLFTTLDFGMFKANFRSRMLYAYIAGCLISVLLIFNNAVFSYFQTQSTDVFYYIKLGFTHHPSYLALYYTFAIAVLITWIFSHPGGNTSKRNTAFFLILVFQLFIVLLSSKAGIMATALLYMLIIAYLILKREKRLKMLASAVLLTVFLLTLSFFPKSYSRFFNAEQAIENAPDTSTQDGSVARVMVWQSSLEIIKEHPFFGVGTGDVEPELMKIYKEKNIRIALDETLNAHNQYLQTFIALGVVGFLLLIAILLVPAWYAFQQKHLLYMAFLAIFAFNMLVESMLERQAGVTFYAFFNSFLFYYAFVNPGKSDLQEP
jgi:O-antigen ligase